MKKNVKKGLIIGMIVVGVIILISIFSSCNFSKSFPYIGWGNVCSPKCYINQLLGNTLVTNHPVLDIFETFGPNAYMQEYYNSGRNMSVNISVLNIGKTRIPYANITLVDSDVFETVYLWGWDNQWNVYDLEAMESISSSPLMSFNVKDGMTLQPGVYNLKFRVVCPICDEQVYHDYIPVCIYQQGHSAEEDCGGHWWYLNWGLW